MMSPGWRAPCRRSFLVKFQAGAILWDRSGASAAQALTGEIDAMGVVNEAVEDGVGICRVADEARPLSTRLWLVGMVERRGPAMQGSRLQRGKR
jgi:hypothetical protein